MMGILLLLNQLKYKKSILNTDVKLTKATYEFPIYNLYLT